MGPVGAYRPVRPRLALAAGAALLALAGCGFQLQGAQQLSPVMGAAYLDAADRYTDFHQALADALRVAGAKLVRERADAKVVVEVQRDESGQRVLSVSARNTPTEYEVYYTVVYRVRAGDRELLAPQTLTLTREYSFDETRLLAKEQEQEFIRAALARELAALVMRRLAALPT
jgi:LPS-assembly lipoprotein